MNAPRNDELERLKASRDANLSLYSEYNKTLRAWLVAFGIAVPAVFVTSKDVKEFLLKAPDFQTIIVVFFIGVASQIFISFLNKFISWSAFHRDDCRINADRECHVVFKTVSKLENHIWIDLILDVASLGCFSWAIVKLLTINPV